MAIQAGVFEDPGVAGENREVYRFVAAVNKLPGAVALKVHGDMYTRDQPDTVGVYCGLPYAFEWKKSPRKQLSPGQKLKLKKWADAGALTGVFWRCEDGLKALADYAAAKLPHVVLTESS